MWRTIAYILAVVIVFLTLSALFRPLFDHLADYQQRALFEADGLYMHRGDGTPVNHFIAGENFVLRILNYQRADCRVAISYRIIQEIAETEIEVGKQRMKSWHRIVYYSYPFTQAYTQAGHYITDYKLQLPTTLAPGDYVMDAVRMYYCGGVGQTAISQNPRVAFTVEATQ